MPTCRTEYRECGILCSSFKRHFHMSKVLCLPLCMYTQLSHDNNIIILCVPGVEMEDWSLLLLPHWKVLLS